jgi:hypothetical protein
MNRVSRNPHATGLGLTNAYSDFSASTGRPGPSVIPGYKLVDDNNPLRGKLPPMPPWKNTVAGTGTGGPDNAVVYKQSSVLDDIDYGVWTGDYKRFAQGESLGGKYTPSSLNTEQLARGVGRGVGRWWDKFQTSGFAKGMGQLADESPAFPMLAGMAVAAPVAGLAGYLAHRLGRTETDYTIPAASAGAVLAGGLGLASHLYRSKKSFAMGGDRQALTQAIQGDFSAPSALKNAVLNVVNILPTNTLSDAQRMLAGGVVGGAVFALAKWLVGMGFLPAAILGAFSGFVTKNALDLLNTKQDAHHDRLGNPFFY